jgi:hypothetical protein
MTKTVRGNNIRVGDKIGGRLVIQVRHVQDEVILHHGSGCYSAIPYNGLFQIERPTQIENHDVSDVLWTSESNGYR